MSLHLTKTFTRLEWLSSHELYWEGVAAGQTFAHIATWERGKATVTASAARSKPTLDHPSIPRKVVLWSASHPAAQWMAAIVCDPDTLPFHQNELWLRRDGDWMPLTFKTPGAFSQVQFDRTGHFLYCVWDGGGFAQLYRYHLTEKHWETLTLDERDWTPPNLAQLDPTYVLAPDGITLWGISHTNGRAALVELQAAEKRQKFVNALAMETDFKGISLSPDGRKLALICASSQKPPRVLVYDTVAKRIHVLDESLTLSPRATFPFPKHLRWTSKDSRVIHGWFYEPALRSRVKPPLVLLVHDGPESCVMETWPVKARELTERGYAVLYVNYRGSTSLGRRYRESLYGHWGKAEVDDIVSGRDVLVAQGLADGGRCALWGGRFGGTSVLQTLSAYPEAFAAAVVVYPVLHFSKIMHAPSHPYKTKLRYLLGAPSALETCPLNKAAKIKTPLALFHGQEDPDIPVSDVKSFADDIRNHGGQVTLHAYPGMKQRFQDPSQFRDYNDQVFAFLAEHLHPERHEGKPYRDYSHELKLSSSPALRALLVMASMLFLLIGIIGVFIPLLPTTPFLLLAAALFARSSGLFYNKLMNHGVLGPPLRQWHETRSIPKKIKIIAVAMILCTLVPSALLVVPILAVKVGLLLFAAGMIGFILRIPTRNL